MFNSSTRRPSYCKLSRSRWLFTAMASTEGNVIILTSRSEDGTLARDLYSRWETQQADGTRWGQGKIGRVHAMHEPFAVEVSTFGFLSSEIGNWGVR
jgi:hypothetical protein